MSRTTPPVFTGTIADAQIETVRTDAGVLVFKVDMEHREHLGREVLVSRRLVGFADIDSKSALRDELSRRGLGRGAVDHLETFEPEEVGL